MLLEFFCDSIFFFCHTDISPQERDSLHLDSIEYIRRYLDLKIKSTSHLSRIHESPISKKGIFLIILTEILLCCYTSDESLREALIFYLSTQFRYDESISISIDDLLDEESEVSEFEISIL